MAVMTETAFISTSLRIALWSVYTVGAAMRRFGKDGSLAWMKLILNGQRREFEELTEGTTLSRLIAALELKGDRVAVELNGAIAARQAWESVVLRDGDKLEIVQFVGGGRAGEAVI
jgi:sulfur carrier protein